MFNSAKPSNIDRNLPPTGLGEEQALDKEIPSRDAVRDVPRSSGGLPSGSIPVLCYHRFLPNFTQSKVTAFSIPPELLEQQFSILKEQGIRTLSLGEYNAIATGRSPSQPDSVMITIDDGYADMLTKAMPIAEKFGVTLNLFVLTRKVGRVDPYVIVPRTEAVTRSIAENPREWEMLSWEELRELHQRGVGIGMHGHTHDKMCDVPLPRITEDLRKGIRTFESELGFAPNTFAIPYGNPYSYSTTHLRLLHELGFRVIFSTERGCSMVPHVQNPLPRHVVSPADSLKEFEAKLQAHTNWSFQLKRIFRPHPRLAVPDSDSQE